MGDFVMGRTKALLFMCSIAMACFQTARAADLLPPAPPLDEPSLRGALADESGFYLRFDAGVANTNASDLRSTYADGSTTASLGEIEGPVSVGDAAILGLGAGYRFNNWLRADLTGEYRPGVSYHASSTYKFDSFQNGYNVSPCPATAGANNSWDVNAATYCGDEYTGTVKAGLFLANGYVDFGDWYGFTPYVGAGVGFAAYQVDGVKDNGLYPSTPGSFGFARNVNGTSFAWALMAGAAYHLTPNLLIDIGYRYANMGTFKTGMIDCNDQPACHYETQQFTVASNDVRVGLRWLMLEPVAPPVVRARY